MDVASGLRLVEAMERAVTAQDHLAAAEYLDAEVSYTVGARPTLIGVAAIIVFAAEQGEFARWDGHTLKGAWASDGGLVVEVVSHFTRVRDGRRISFPCTDIYRFREGRIVDWRVYADMSPFQTP